MITLIAITAGFLIVIVLQLINMFTHSKTVILSRINALENKLEERTRLSDKLLQDNIATLQEKTLEKLHESNTHLQQHFHQQKESLTTAMQEHRQGFDKRQMESLQTLQVSLQKGLKLSSDMIGERVEKLTTETGKHLKDISAEVEKRLTQGFEKTTEVFTNIVKRLAIIDEAQKKITELSSSVVSLQEVLNDKRSRGAFGEVQLNSLIRNVLPENHFKLQYTFSNSTRVDCMLFLPEPTGNIAIDAKFPLETYRLMTDTTCSDTDRLVHEKQFKRDVKKHIHDIADKYIIPGETSDGALMFIPAEAVFAEIHAHHPDLIELAQKHHVWIVSPTTMMAILTTARAVIKDEATQQQVHIIREHLGHLAQDFNRFQVRMDNLSKHINMAQKDVDQVHTTAKKISSRFSKIESVELTSEDKREVSIEE